MRKMMDHIMHRMPDRNTMIRDIGTGEKQQESKERGYSTTMNEIAHQIFHKGSTTVHSTRLRLRKRRILRQHFAQVSSSHSRGASYRMLGRERILGRSDSSSRAMS
mmetsp:Transcript_69171/g.181208  ORF Transcript_69171/g.181208 Transcript_69171/m.181208 type:complete len:106 (-) Transcript_69171:531-848(-)